jgi:hypothetical protein
MELLKSFAAMDKAQQETVRALVRMLTKPLDVESPSLGNK